MKKDEEKRKVGRPKLADSDVKKNAMKSVTVALVAAFALALGGLLTLTNFSFSRLTGAVATDNYCEDLKVSASSNSVTVKWNCSKHKVSQLSLYEDNGGEVTSGKALQTKKYGWLFTLKKGTYTFKNLENAANYAVKTTYTDNNTELSSVSTAPALRVNVEASSTNATVDWNAGDNITKGTITVYKSNALKLRGTKVNSYAIYDESGIDQGVQEVMGLVPGKYYLAYVTINNVTTKAHFKTVNENVINVENISDNNATITWSTDEAKALSVSLYYSVAKVPVGLPVVLKSAKDLDGQLELENLKRATNYYAVVRYENGEVAKKMFKTTAQYTVAVSTKVLTDTSVSISWKTDALEAEEVRIYNVVDFKALGKPVAAKEVSGTEGTADFEELGNGKTYYAYIKFNNGLIKKRLFKLTGSYTLVFNANGGTGEMDDQVVKYNKLTKISKNEMTRGGYNFVGWYAKRTDGKIFGYKVVTIKEKSTKVYYWSKNPEHYATLKDQKALLAFGKKGDFVTLYAIWEQGGQLVPSADTPVTEIATDDSVSSSIDSEPVTDFEDDFDDVYDDEYYADDVSSFEEEYIDFDDELDFDDEGYYYED